MVGLYLTMIGFHTIHLYHNRQSSFKREYGLKAANLLLDLQDALENTKDRGTSPSNGLTSLVPQNVPPLVKGPHMEEVVQDAVVHTGLFLFHSTSNPNVVPPEGVVVVTIPKGISMPTTSGLVIVCHLHTTQDRTIDNLEGTSISRLQTPNG